MSRSWIGLVLVLLLASAADESWFAWSLFEEQADDDCECGESDGCPPLCADDGCVCCAALAPFAVVNLSGELRAAEVRVRFDETLERAPDLPDLDGLARVPIAPHIA